MRSMVRRVTSSAPEIDDILTETENTPFTRRITRTKVPMNNKLRLPVYDGIEDPMVFLRAFNVKVARADFGRATEDQGKCQLFVESLRGEAQAWFTKLPRDSIGSFEDLRTIFINQYMMFREEPLKPIDLTSTRQSPKETLHDFIKRFKDIYAKIRIPDDLAIDSLIQGLPQGSSLRFDLTSRRPQSMVDAFYRAHVHAKMEGTNPIPLIPSGTSTKTRESTSDDRNRHQQSGERIARKQNRNILLAARTQAFKKPWRNTYHRGQSIDPLGKETSGIKDSMPEKEVPRRAVGDHSSRDHHVNVILGRHRPVYKRFHSEALLAQERAEIYSQTQPNLLFPDDDQDDIDDYSEPLLIQVVISHYRIGNVLVDTGSTCNVIDVAIFTEMGENIPTINFREKRLTSFCGNPVESFGSVYLPVMVGGVTRPTPFELVNQPFGYSIILGIPWLYQTKAIVSIYNKSLRVPIPGGYFPVAREQFIPNSTPNPLNTRAQNPRTSREPDSESDEEDDDA